MARHFLLRPIFKCSLQLSLLFCLKVDWQLFAAVYIRMRLIFESGLHLWKQSVYFCRFSVLLFINSKVHFEMSLVIYLSTFIILVSFLNKKKSFWQNFIFEFLCQNFLLNGLISLILGWDLEGTILSNFQTITFLLLKRHLPFYSLKCSWMLSFQDFFFAFFCQKGGGEFVCAYIDGMCRLRWLLLLLKRGSCG